MRRLLVLERHDWSQWEDRWTRDEANSRWPYGANRLDDLGWKVAHPEAAKWERGWREKIARRTLEPRGHDFDLHHPVATARLMVGNDAVLSIFEEMAWPWLYGSRRLPPLMVMSCWLGQRLLNPHERAVEHWVRVMRRASAFTVFSENQVPLLVQRIGVAEEKIAVLRYGVDTSYFTPSGDRAGYVAAVGKDVGRDWSTLLAAAAQTPHIPYKLVTSPERLRGLNVPDNVEVSFSASAPEYRAILREAAFVVVPTYPLAYPTGQSVLLESLSCGTAVVTSRTPAMRNYAHPEAVISVQPGEADELATAIGALFADPQRATEMGAAGRQLAVDRYGTDQMWDAVSAHLDVMLSA